MTEEEAIKEIIDMANALQLIPSTPKGKAVSMALKALEKEPILDKIRDEIKVMTSNRGFLSCSVGHIHEEIDNVFDKYKIERN